MLRGHGTPPATRPRALVLGIEHPRGIAVVRSLGRRGISVVGVERDPDARGRGSRYLRQVVVVEGGDTGTLAALEAPAAAPSDLLIPTNDHFLSLVSRHISGGPARRWLRRRCPSTTWRFALHGA